MELRLRTNLQSGYSIVMWSDKSTIKIKPSKTPKTQLHTFDVKKKLFIIFPKKKPYFAIKCLTVIINYNQYKL